MIQLSFAPCNVLVRQILEVRTIGDILPCEPIGILIGASFPEVVWSGKEEPDIQPLCNLLVSRNPFPLSAVIVRIMPL